MKGKISETLRKAEIKREYATSLRQTADFLESVIIDYAFILTKGYEECENMIASFRDNADIYERLSEDMFEQAFKAIEELEKEEV